MTDEKEIEGPWIIWEDCGSEGWRPKTFPTLGALLLAQEPRYNSRWIITKRVELEVSENGKVTVCP